MPTEVLHVGCEDLAGGHGLPGGLDAALLLDAHDVVGDPHDGADVALEFAQEKIQIFTGLKHGLLVDLVVARQREDVRPVCARGGVELLPDLGVARPQVRGRQLSHQGHPPVHARGQVGVVREVHQAAGRVFLDAHGRLELADELRCGVPGVGVGAPDLGLAHVLVVNQNMRHGRRNSRVEHAVDGDIERGRHEHEHVDVLVLDVQRGSDLDAVRDQPGVVLLDHGLRRLTGDLRVPVESPVGQDFGDLLAVVELPDHPRDEPVGKEGPERLLAEGHVVAVEELAELVAAGLAVYLAVEPLGHAGGLYGVEALEHRGLVRHQLPQEELGLRYVHLAHRRAILGYAVKHFRPGSGRKK